MMTRRIFVLGLGLGAAALGGCVFAQRTALLQERGVAGPFVESRVQDTASQKHLPDWCNRVEVDYERRARGFEDGLRRGQVVVNHRGGADCGSRTLTRESSDLGKWRDE